MSAAGHTDDGDGPLGRIIWRVVDAADYWLMQAVARRWTRCAVPNRRQRLMKCASETRAGRFNRAAETDPAVATFAETVGGAHARRWLDSSPAPVPTVGKRCTPRYAGCRCSRTF